jgi:methyltransferase (TIGR00027 family)
MNEGHMIWSAEAAAALRATESAKPEDERVCYDYLAKDFLCKNRLLRNFFLWIAQRLLTPGASSSGQGARTQYIDDSLKACIDDGIQQLVNLGAGFDTRAYRFDELKAKVRVFELDHPATLKIKVEKVRKIFGSLPDHVVYVPIDFEKEKLSERLFESGYDRNLKTLFIWEAVSYYLTIDEVEGTLAFIVNNSGEGSSIIFDYMFQSVLDGTNTWKGAEKWQKAIRRSDGRNFGITEGTIEEFLSNRGFHQVKDATGEFLKNTYLKAIEQSKRHFFEWGIVHATVKPREGTKEVVQL